MLEAVSYGGSIEVAQSLLRDGADPDIRDAKGVSAREKSYVYGPFGIRRAIEEDDVNYIRGRVSRIYEEDGKLVVMGADTLANGRPVELFRRVATGAGNKRRLQLQKDNC